MLAAGGTSFLSHLLGSRTNTGDGYLLAAEAGAEMSGMEFTAAYTISASWTCRSGRTRPYVSPARSSADWCIVRCIVSRTM